MSIELFRVLLMFCICMIHVVGKGDYAQSWLANLLKLGVPGFIFISGWFGVSFSWKKIVELYGLGIWAAMVGACGWGLCEGGSFLGRFVTDLRWFWFLHSYVILLIISPLINAGLTHLYNLGEKEFITSLFPFALFFWGWAFMAGVGHLRTLVFNVPGLETHSPLTLIGIYVFARSLKMLEVECLLKDWMLWALIGCCLPFSVIGLGNYNSPFVFLLVASLFLLFKRSSMKCQKWLCWVTPSLFSIYLLHSTLFGLTLFINFEDW